MIVDSLQRYCKLRYLPLVTGLFLFLTLSAGPGFGQVDYRTELTDYVEWLDLKANGPSPSSWVKFMILSKEKSLYFQNSVKYPLHYDFATKHLPVFRGVSPQEFTRRTLYGEGRLAFVGSLVQTYSEDGNLTRWGIQIVSIDPLNLDEIESSYQLIISKTQKLMENSEIFVIPTAEQRAAFEELRSQLAERKIQVRSMDLFFGERKQQIYSEGFTVGKVIKSSSKTIEEDYRQGRIGPLDIVLIDEVLAEMPSIGAIVSKTHSVPSSHTALLFRQKAKPFIYSADSVLWETFESFVGKEIFFGVNQEEIFLQGAEEGLTEAWARQLKDLRSVGVRKQPIRDSEFSRLLPTGRYGRADANRFGAKSANYSELQMLLGSKEVVDGMGIPFYYYEQFMETPSGDKTLRGHVSEVLARHQAGRNIEKLTEDLAELRRRIEATPIPQKLYQEIISQLLQVFPAKTKMLFLRSSTNAEDGEEFNGAGLYSSKAGRICDDDLSCEPLPGGKRKPLATALKVVWASLFNTNAILALKEYGIRIDLVSMGILVNPFHTGVRANGVAVSQGSDRFMVSSQKDLIEVTNPDPGIKPEVVDITISEPGVQQTIRQTSSLMPAGWSVLSADEYHSMALSLARVKKHYLKYTKLDLDFEWLKLEDGRVVLTQVRPIPQALAQSKMRGLAPIVFGGARIGMATCVGENQSAARFLRSKTAITYDREMMFFTANDVAKNYMRNIEIVRGSDSRSRYQFSDLGQLPGLQTRFELVEQRKVPDWNSNRELNYRSEKVEHSFKLSQQPLMTTYEILDSYREELGELLLKPFYFQLVDHGSRGRYRGENVPIRLQGITIDHNELPHEIFPENFGNRELKDSFRFCVFDANKGISAQPRATILVDSEFIGQSVHIEMSHYVSDPKEDPMMKTYFLTPTKTTFHGVIDQPFTISSWFAAAHAPFHHNFSEEILFDVEKDESLSGEVLMKLRKANIRWISLSAGFDESRPGYGKHSVFTLSEDGKNRRRLANDLVARKFPW